MEYLNKIGITNLNDIDSYSLRTEGARDVLKIYYKDSGHFLFQKSEKFYFPRAEKAVVADSGKQIYNNMSTPSNLLQNILMELDSHISERKSSLSKKKRAMQELAHLEKVMQRKIDEIRRTIGDM